MSLESFEKPEVVDVSEAVGLWFTKNADLKHKFESAKLNRLVLLAANVAGDIASDIAGANPRALKIRQFLLNRLAERPKVETSAPADAVDYFMHVYEQKDGKTTGRLAELALKSGIKMSIFSEKDVRVVVTPSPSDLPSPDGFMAQVVINNAEPVQIWPPLQQDSAQYTPSPEHFDRFR